MPADSTTADAPTGWIEALAAEPALVVLLLAGLATAVVAAILLRLRRAVREARARGALADWLLGAEDALGANLSSARERLQRVVELDAENHGARTLLAETLLALDEPSAAHEHCLTLERAFGVANRRVAWGTVRALAAAGRRSEAAERLARIARAGDDLRQLEQRLAIERAAGLPEEVVRTAALLVPRLPADGSESVRLAAAQALDEVRRVRAGAGDAARADAARREAMLVLQGLQGARAALLRRRLERGPRPGSGKAGSTAVADDGGRPGLPATLAVAQEVLLELAREAAEAPYRCATCALSTDRMRAHCPACGSAAPVEVREPLLHRALPSAAAVSDEIEETEAHAQRLLERVLAGDEHARDELVESGAPGVGPLFRRALVDAGAREALVGVLQVMGPPILDALLAAYESVRADNRLTGSARERAADVVGRVVRTFGRAALPSFQQHLDAEDRDLRKIVVDFYLGLDDADELQAVLDRYPPVEVIQRLNATPADRLQAWLQNVPAEGFVAEVLLANPMFRRDEDLLLAAARAASSGPLLAVLARRGPSSELATVAVDRLADEAVCEVARGLLASYGPAAADALLAGYLDLDRPPAARDRARALLGALGPAIVPKICQCFGASPSRLDEEIVALLVALGGGAIGSLQEAYARRNLLERVGGRLVRRYNHPRNTILKVLARIGGPEARAALLALRAHESDPNLRLRIDQALQVVARTPALPPARAAGETDAQRKDGVG